MTTIRRTTLGLSLLAMSIMGFSCSGNSGEEEFANGLKLEVSKSTLSADGNDAVTFTVRDASSADVTSEAIIRCTTDNTLVEGASFSTKTAGVYKFAASHADANSPTVTVTAKEAEIPSKPSKFVRRICVMEFTGQWCAICPTGYANMMFVIDSYFKEVAHVIALHDNTSGKDEFAIPVQREMAKAFAITGYPRAVVDLRTSCPLTNDASGSLKKAMKASQEEYAAHCGVAVKSVYNETTKTAEVTARIFSEKTENYRLVVFVIEDKIKARQNVNGYYNENYIHNDVARQLVSSSYTGDTMGEIKSDTEATKTYSVPVDAAWNLDNTHIFALAISADGYVNNMITCAIVNGETDYERVIE